MKVHRGLGPPAVYVEKERTGIDINLGHDDRFVACAFEATSCHIH